MDGRLESGVNSFVMTLVAGCLVLMFSLAFSATANAGVLLEQSLGVSPDSIPSQDREPENSQFDTEVVDDFVVPPGKVWRIENVFARGVKIGIGEATDAHVTLRNDNSGSPGVLSLDELAAVKPGTYPRLELTIASKPILQPGTYWLGVQPILNGLVPENTPAAVNQWFWAENPTIAGSAAMFRNPANGFSTGCTSFSLKSTCVFPVPHANPPAAHAESDQMFRLEGTEFSEEPDTTIDSGPADGSTITTNSTSFSFSSSDPESTFECRIDGGAESNCTSPKALTGLTNGPHRFEVRTTNGAGIGDPTPAATEFTVDASQVEPGTACLSARAQLKKALSKKKQAQNKLNKAKSKLRKAKNRKLKAKAAKAVKANQKKLGKAKRTFNKAKAKVKNTC